MTTVLAAVDAHPVAARVVGTAERIADVIGSGVEILHIIESPADELAVVARFGDDAVRCVSGDVSVRIVQAAGDRDVELVVVGARRLVDATQPVGHIARAILERTDRPVVVVPPADLDGSVEIRQALLPLEGSVVSSSTIGAMAARLMDGGVDIVPLHVFDVSTTPAFWDQAAHAADSYAASFAERWSPSSTRVRLRRGEAGPTIVDTAHEQRADLIVLGWSQNLAPGRAQVVRTALRDARVPVLLVPSSATTADS